MNLEMILGVVNKGLSIIDTLSEAGKSISGATSAMRLVTQKGSDVTEAELAETEKLLDAEMDLLETPMDREKTDAE